MIRVLQLPNSISKQNGRMSVIMSIYRRIDKSKIQFDFLASEVDGDTYADEIKQLGGQIYVVPKNKITLSHIKKAMKQVLQKYRYNYVHYHAISIWGATLKIAHQSNIKVITHSHATNYSDSWIKSIRNKIFSTSIFRYTNKYVAVSPEAGKTLFGKKHFEYIPNVINFQRYSFSNDDRDAVRKAFGVSKDDCLIGHVGRLAKQKNHRFLLSAFKLLNERNKHYKLMLVGDGPLATSIRTQIKEMQLSDSVIMVGAQPDSRPYYSAFDLFWLPSLYEGLPTVGLEAQANGLSLIVSTNVSSEVAIGNVVFLPITGKNGLNEWRRVTENGIWQRDLNIKQKIMNSQYEYSKVMQQWENLYGLK